MRWTIRLSALAIALFAGVPSSARDDDARDVAGWAVSPSSDGQGCFLTRTYGGPRQTTLMFGLDIDGGNRLTVLNANWSIRDKERLRLNFRFSQAAFPRHPSVGIMADGKKGFVTSFGTTFPKTFAASAFLTITHGAVPVEELSLAGSGAAVADLRKCVNLHRGTPDAAASKGRDAGRIPVDPFARRPRADIRSVMPSDHR